MGGGVALSLTCQHTETVTISGPGLTVGGGVALSQTRQHRETVTISGPGLTVGVGVALSLTCQSTHRNSHHLRSRSHCGRRSSPQSDMSTHRNSHHLRSRSHCGGGVALSQTRQHTETVTISGPGLTVGGGVALSQTHQSTHRNSHHLRSRSHCGRRSSPQSDMSINTQKQSPSQVQVSLWEEE